MAARKSRLYLNSFITVNQTHDDMVRNIFRAGKFACTITANLQLVGIISLCANLAIVVLSDYCRYQPSNRKLNIGSAVASICNATALYFIFCCGYVVNRPSLWVKINIITNLSLSLITIISQATAMRVCLTVTKIHKSPGPMGLVGGGCLLLSCFTLFLLYRYKELDVEINDIIQERNLSDERNTAISNFQRSISITSRPDEDGKRSGGSITEFAHQQHTKAQVYVKQDDGRRKHTDHSMLEEIHGGQGPKRETSVHSRSDSHSSHSQSHGHRSHSHGHHSRHNGHHTHHSKKKILHDASVNNRYRHDEAYPHCSKSRRQSSMYTKHI